MVRMEFFGPHEQKHKLAPVTKGPFGVMSKTDMTVIAQMGEKQERVSRKRVVGAPPIVKLIRKEVL